MKVRRVHYTRGETGSTVFSSRLIFSVGLFVAIGWKTSNPEQKKEPAETADRCPLSDGQLPGQLLRRRDR